MRNVTDEQEYIVEKVVKRLNCKLYTLSDYSKPSPHVIIYQFSITMLLYLIAYHRESHNGKTEAKHVNRTGICNFDSISKKELGKL